MRFPIRFIPAKTNFQFIRYRVIAFTISIALSLATFAYIGTQGLNLGIDFTGGVLIELKTEEAADLSQMRTLLANENFGEVSLQNFGDERSVLVRIQATDENQAQVVAAVKSDLDAAIKNIDYRRVEFVGPTVGRELIHSAFMALTLAMAAMLVYIWFRFEWQFGVGGILALLHDGIMVLGFYAVMKLEFGATAIAAILTVIGYSINDSVVIYDRIRENMRKFKKMPIEELIDLSVNETLSRTILTGGTTLLALTALALFGGEVIRGFSLAIGFGIIVGTYSSVFISAPVLIYLNVGNIGGEGREPGEITSKTKAAQAKPAR